MREYRTHFRLLRAATLTSLALVLAAPVAATTVPGLPPGSPMPPGPPGMPPGFPGGPTTPPGGPTTPPSGPTTPPGGPTTPPGSPTGGSTTATSHESPDDQHGPGTSGEPTTGVAMTSGPRAQTPDEEFLDSVKCAAECTKSITGEGKYRVDYADGISLVLEGTKLTVLRSGTLLDTITWTEGAKAPQLVGYHGSFPVTKHNVTSSSIRDYFTAMVALRDAQAIAKHWVPVNRNMMLMV